MELREYIENTKGFGVLATSDANGVVNTAIYARPHVLAEGRVTFIMADRLTRKNLRENPSASYLFIEEGKGYRGARLQLTRLEEELNPELIAELRRRTYSPDDEARIAKLTLVHFRLDEQRPLIGAGPPRSRSTREAGRRSITLRA
mgnify:CR=1 FL=1